MHGSTHEIRSLGKLFENDVESDKERENLTKPLYIKSEEADQLARQLAERTGESLTQAVIVALRERLERNRAQPDYDSIVEDVLLLAERFIRLPVLDARSSDEIIGYDEYGVAK